MTFGSLEGEDLGYCSHFLDRTGIDLGGTSILITGGTGFLGKWLTLFILWQKRQLGKQIKLYLLTRNVANFKKQFKASFWTPDDVIFLEGSINDPLSIDEPVDLIVHGATDVVNAAKPALTITTCLTGTDHVLEFAKTHGTSRIVLLSSGAVYANPDPWVPPTKPTACNCRHAECRRLRRRQEPCRMAHACEPEGHVNILLDSALFRLWRAVHPAGQTFRLWKLHRKSIAESGYRHQRRSSCRKVISLLRRLRDMDFYNIDVGSQSISV